jgi:hypothetical protein
LDAVLYYPPVYHITPEQLFQNIASAAIGPRAFELGWKSTALGVAFHCLIAFTVTAAYYLLSRWLNFIPRYPWLCGPLFGVGVHAVMQLLVLPHTELTRGPRVHFWSDLFDELFTHAFLVGLPIALILRRYSDGGSGVEADSLRE